MSGFSALIARAERASGPDPELDALIVAEINNALLKPYPPATDFGPHDKWQFWSKDGAHFLGSEGKFKVPPYSSSFEAAMALVPESSTKWIFFQSLNEGGFQASVDLTQDANSFGASPALALTAAALRARDSVRLP